jgi:hypothetical protein
MLSRILRVLSTLRHTMRNEGEVSISHVLVCICCTLFRRIILKMVHYYPHRLLQLAETKTVLAGDGINETYACHCKYTRPRHGSTASALITQVMSAGAVAGKEEHNNMVRSIKRCGLTASPTIVGLLG